jgi:hypothetical protein
MIGLAAGVASALAADAGADHNLKMDSGCETGGTRWR